MSNIENDGNNNDGHKNDGHKNKPQKPEQPNVRLGGNDGHKFQQHIQIQPNIGLDSDVRQWVAKILNTNLADEAVLAQKMRGAHWNVSGTGFFELHILFETQYNQLNEITDKLAQRVRMLGSIAIASFEQFLSHTRLKEKSAVIPDNLNLLADHETVIRFLREDIRKCNDEYEDEGTVELLVGVMSLHEKMAWLLRSYIEPSLPPFENKII